MIRLILIFSILVSILISNASCNLTHKQMRDRPNSRFSENTSKMETYEDQKTSEGEAPPQVVYQKESYLHRGIYYEGEKDKLTFLGRIDAYTPGPLDPKTTDDLTANYADLLGADVFVIEDYEDAFLFVERSDGKIDIFHKWPNGPKWQEYD